MATESVPVLREARYTVSSTFDERRMHQLAEVQTAEAVDTATALRDLAWDTFYAAWKKGNA